MSKPIVGDSTNECHRCGHWYKDSYQFCQNPNCQEPNPDWRAKNDRFQPIQYGKVTNTDVRYEMVEGVLVRIEEE